MTKIKTLILIALFLPLALSCTTTGNLHKTYAGCSSCAGSGGDFPLSRIYDSTLLIEGVIVDKGKKKEIGSYTGSGGVVWQAKDSTIVMTAAHVCHVPELIESIKKISPNPDDIKHQIKVTDRKNRTYSAISYVSALKFDVCLIQISKIEGVRALPLANEAPQLGEIIYNVASPLGLYSSHGSPMFKGYYSGDFKFVNVEQDKHSLFSLPAAPGSSGSLLLNKHMEIVGVVSAVYTRFHHLTISPTLKQIKDLMNGKAETVERVFIDFTPQIVVEEKTFVWGQDVPEWDILEENEEERWKIK